MTLTSLENVSRPFSPPPPASAMDGLLAAATEHGRLCGTERPELFRNAALALHASNDERPVSSMNLFGGQTTLFYLAMLVLALGAAIQGADETVINGAQTFFIPQFGIEGNEWYIGLTNGAPYLCCALLGCWLTIPVNARLGRRNAIILASFIQLASCIGQAFSKTWQGMMAARLILGIGVGINSATVPMFAAEVAPAHIRGAIGMLWQFFTAFGIMMGNAVSLALFRIPNSSGIHGLAWRLMMGSPAVIAIVILCLAPLCPESPRYLLIKGRHAEAYNAMCRFRVREEDAVRDLFQAYWQEQVMARESKISTLATIASMAKPRNRRAVYASQLVMFMQQFCGVNVIAYYSTMILKNAGYTDLTALGCSLGLGAANFLFAIPAFFIIDRFGRRPLLLFTLPVMAGFLALTGAAFYLNGEAQNAVVITGLVLFMVTYSPGAGPVPFPYCAEVHATAVRPYGMSLNTATTWFFNFVISVTFPPLKKHLTEPGVFFYYAAWNIVLFFAVNFIVRETKGLRLEEVDETFQTSTLKFAGYQARCLWSRVTFKSLPPPLVRTRSASDSEGEEDAEKASL